MEQRETCPGSLHPGEVVVTSYGHPVRVRCRVCGRIVNVQVSYHMADARAMRHKPAERAS